MASIPPNVENTEYVDFFKLGQDCEQVGENALSTCSLVQPDQWQPVAG